MKEVCINIKRFTKKSGDIVEAHKRCYTLSGLNEDNKGKFNKFLGLLGLKKSSPEEGDKIKKLSDGNIKESKDSELYEESRNINPISEEEANKAISGNKTAKKILDRNYEISEGEQVGVRLNLNVLKSTGVPAQAIHKKNFNGKVLTYKNGATLKDVKFNVSQKGRDDVVNGIKNKFPLASIDGGYSGPPEDYGGIEISFNPFKGHLFVDKQGRPIKSADEVTVMAHRAYARGNIEYYDESEAPQAASPSSVEFPTDFRDEIEEIKNLLEFTNRESKGSKLFSEPNPETAEIAEEYRSISGIGVESRDYKNEEGKKVVNLDTQRSRDIADAFDSMKHDPKNPEVLASYQAMAKETLAQYEVILDSGYEIEMYDGKQEPYKTSKDMITDLRDNNHLWIFPTADGFGSEEITKEQISENPLLAATKYKDKNGKPMVVNDVFRAVHDFFGHSEHGNGFGAKGEEVAWDNHSRMYSDLARRAMTTETRGQNSWVNFGKHLRKEDGSLPKKGEEGYVSPVDRPFADQKIGLLPLEYSQRDDEGVLSNTDKELTSKSLGKRLTKKLTDDGNGNYIFTHFSKQELKKNDPSKIGDNRLTSREESSAYEGTDGATFFYTNESTQEAGTGDIKHTVTIPKEKVYPFNKDPLFFLDKAEADMRAYHENDNRSFRNANEQLAWVSQVAAENGFDMVVAKWNGQLRAQTSKKLDLQVQSEVSDQDAELISNVLTNLENGLISRDEMIELLSSEYGIEQNQIDQYLRESKLS